MTGTPPARDIAEALARFDALVGVWQMEVSFPRGAFGPDSPALTSRDGQTTFEWLGDRAFLIQRFGSGKAGGPSGIAIIGAADEPGAISQYYFDSRGVRRTYTTSLEGRTWRVWREAPGFSQRYTGVLSDDGARIEGAWEKSADARDWQHDFELNYVR